MRLLQRLKSQGVKSYLLLMFLQIMIMLKIHVKIHNSVKEIQYKYKLQVIIKRILLSFHGNNNVINT